MEYFREQYRLRRLQIEQQVLNFNPVTILGGQALPWWQNVIARHAQGAADEEPHRQLYSPELIRCYWLEEGMLVQGMEAIAMRFQNKRVGVGNALARFDISPLRRISHLLWGFIDDEQRRLGIRRRALEYAHQYGLRLVGRAVGNLRPADDRSPFLRAFHTMLNISMQFYREFDDLTKQQDARPVLSALKELHIVLSEGSSNQFGTVPLQARVEMMMIQDLLGSAEIGRFLGGSLMVVYPELWMDRVETLRRLMRWGDTSIVEFWNLARMGEEIPFTVRFGPFGPAQANAQVADDWAVALRNQVCQYVHSYRAVTGVDLSAKLVSGQSIDATLPSRYLADREAHLQRTAT